MADITRTREYVNYNYGRILTPFNKLDQHWDRPIGAWREKAAKWRTSCLALMLVNVVLVVLFLSLLAGPRQQVFGVQVQKNGFVEAVGPLIQSPQVMADVTQLFLNQYLQSVLGDQRFAKDFTEPKRWSEVQQTLQALKTQGEQFDVMGMQLINPGVYQLNLWWLPQGKDSSQAKKVALTFHVKALNNASASILKQNPLALMVNGVSLTEVGSTDGQK